MRSLWAYEHFPKSGSVDRITAISSNGRAVIYTSPTTVKSTVSQPDDNAEATSAVATARRCLEHAVTHLDTDPNSIERLEHPAAVHEVTVPAEREWHSRRIHWLSRAPRQRSRPYKGGLRYHPGVTREEWIGLLMWITLKCAVRDPPFDGAKDSVVDPKEQSTSEKERLTRRALIAREACDYDDPLEETIVAV